MASQTEAQVKTEISDRCAVLQELSKFCGINASGNISNYVAREETAQDDPAGDYTVQSNQAMKSGIRGPLAGAVGSPTALSVLGPLFLNYALVDATVPETDPSAAFLRIRRRYVLNNFSVKSRNITYGSFSAASNIGSGVINRLTVDEDGFDLENCHVEAKAAECIADSAQGGTAPHEEKFQFRGATKKIDQLQITGSGWLSEVSAVSARNNPFNNNPSWDSLDGSSITSLTSLPGWTVGAEGISNYNLDRTNYYRDFQGAVDPAALKFLNNGSVEQLFSASNVSVVQNQPYYTQIAFNREVGACNGTLWLSVGSASVSVNLTSQTGWNILRLPLTRNCWPKNFANSTAPKVKIVLTGRTTGTLLIDDFIFAPMAFVDGTYALPVGGATKFVANSHDRFTVTDTFVGSDSVNQQWFWRAFGLVLPGNKVGGETWTDASV